MEEYSHINVDKPFIKNIVKNLRFNEMIGKYYEKLIDEFEYDGSNTLSNKLERLQSCNQFWEIDKYKLSKVKDFKKTNLCKDKFCNNCKKVKQASRMARFMPEIEKYKNKNMSQMVLTVPNVTGEELKNTIKNIFKSFTTLIEYLKGKKKIRGFDFDSLGYLGAIRSLEITYEHNEYHPHLHVLLVHEGDLGLKEHINTYSYNKFNRDEIRRFSELEITIQKIWFLLITGKGVTGKKIRELDLGYSCMIDKFNEGDYLELFKYMTKSDGDEQGSIMTYDNFKTLYFALLGVRQIQGYGVLYRIKDDESILEDVEEKYQAIIDGLRQKESPVEVSEAPQDLLKDSEYTLISRKKVYSYLRQL